ncbi:hypothetical protein [Agrilutibacter solisilvae]|uniref:Uncharacterized protein n=1 Tax=Agrilutibacter solisilvae TaxID=2763317 RepID=A0A974XY11_9GAMM|nr:hypothetical protein [Lysobacter solisilvae]QSX77856.1 hypothetical protein I8J32_014165 [Lysobacter solisilvae]
MKPQIAMFKFTLGTGQSIGPVALQTLWIRACQSPDVSVGRQPARFGAEDRPTYALYASQHLEDLPQIELRLRRLLEESKLRFSLVPMHR